MRNFTSSFDGLIVDLDDLKTYKHLPNDCNKLDDLMFKEIGMAICYMDYFHADIFNNGSGSGLQQRQRINNLIYDFTKNRINNYSNVIWYQEQVFLFQDETENMC